jgi:hypothetical protein
LGRVDVWASGSQLLLAQRAVDGDGAAAALETLALLRLGGAIVTADADSGSPTLARACRRAGAEYVFALAGHCSVQQPQHVEAAGTSEPRVVQAVGLGEPRRRRRKTARPLHSAIELERTRAVAAGVRTERLYCLTSLPPDPAIISRHLRGHFAFESQLSYGLDVVVDQRRGRLRRARVENATTIARLAARMLKRERSAKLSLAHKRRRAAWSHDYMLQVLTAGDLAT